MDRFTQAGFKTADVCVSATQQTRSTGSDAIEPLIAVEFAIYNLPPTALTVSFSNTEVANVPLTLILSNSATPSSAPLILKPLSLVAKLEV